MRTINSMKNIYMSLLTQIVIVLLGFISRKVFLDSLGTEYLGINGLLSNVLSMLSLAEGGIGVSIVYNLYKPLADNDRCEITALIQLYKKVYLIIACTVLVLSFSLYPFINRLVEDGENIPFLNIVYFIFVINNVISYLNAHKWSLINADQKGYLLTKYNIIFKVITSISQIIILKITNNYILFLIIELAITLIQNIYNGKVVYNLYPYICTNKKYKIDKITKHNIVQNVKALFLHNIGTYCVFGTDNLLISFFINVKTVGLYSNYTLVIGQLGRLISPIITSIEHSIGNLVASESKEKVYEIFKSIYLVNFWIYSVAVIFLYNLLEPFINIWLGEGLLLNRLTLIVILINFYITGLRKTISTFKSKAGIFTNDKYVPILEAIVNLGSSIILVRYLGLAGIFMGTIISSLLFPVWIQSRLVYKNVFSKSFNQYLRIYIIYAVLTIITGIFTTLICSKISITSEFVNLIIKGFICIIFPSFVYICVFYNNREFKFIQQILLRVMSNLSCKITSKIKTNV